MGALSHKWLRIIRRKFSIIRSSNKDITLPYTRRNQIEEEEEETTTIEDYLSSSAIDDNKEDLAAIKIQAYFRGHLARRAYRGLRSIVKVQALVRGVFVRKQSHIAMQSLSQHFSPTSAAVTASSFTGTATATAA
ncbi:IQ-domain [Stylosanthes scabra]|uniref:IQ-domain n=1 Tax=Stylosanthes scabra TaxID=79078 RepID=A0ABU6TER4_9FABA|nr:IQ-domain [Stylosanthes scabra]